MGKHTLWAEVESDELSEAYEDGQFDSQGEAMCAAGNHWDGCEHDSRSSWQEEWDYDGDDFSDDGSDWPEDAFDDAAEADGFCWSDDDDD